MQYFFWFLDQIVPEPESKNVDARCWSWSLKFEYRLHSPGCCRVGQCAAWKKRRIYFNTIVKTFQQTHSSNSTPHSGQVWGARCRCILMCAEKAQLLTRYSLQMSQVFPPSTAFRWKCSSSEQWWSPINWHSLQTWKFVNKYLEYLKASSDVQYQGRKATQTKARVLWYNVIWAVWTSRSKNSWLSRRGWVRCKCLFGSFSAAAKQRVCMASNFTWAFTVYVTMQFQNTRNQTKYFTKWNSILQHG